MSMLSNALSVQDYKNIFDANNYKSDSYEMALFITFLMNKNIGNKEMEDLTGLKKSQVFSYKKVIKHNKTEELRTTAFRNVLKSCSDTAKPKLEEEIINAIENLHLENNDREVRPRRSKYEAPHIFNEWELSPGRSTRYRHDFCPCGLETGPTEGGEKFVHIPEFGIATQTLLRLDEVFEYEQEIDNLKKRVKQLEMENTALRAKRKRTSV